MKRFRHEHQLRQLRRFDPATARRAETLKMTAPATAAKIITTAMQQVLTNLTDPKERLWAAIIAQIDSQKLPLIKGGQVEIGWLHNRPVTLNLRDDGQIFLYDGYGTSSWPIARFGNDEHWISSAHRGHWKLTLEARRNFEQWWASVTGPKRYWWPK